LFLYILIIEQKLITAKLKGIIMSKWQMIKFIIWASFKDPFMLTGLLCMVSGSFYTAVGIYYGSEFAVWMMNVTIDIMYVWVIPAYIWWPQTIVAEIVEEKEM
jgi:hypothetical protein